MYDDTLVLPACPAAALDAALEDALLRADLEALLDPAQVAELIRESWDSIPDWPRPAA